MGYHRKVLERLELPSDGVHAFLDKLLLQRSQRARTFRQTVCLNHKKRTVLSRRRTEDERNDYIRDMLDREEYVIKDQTRRGLSSSGVSSGEIDILVEKDNYPFTVIEALILKSMNKDYLGKHLDKIYTYDTTGDHFNVCLVYAECRDFSSFWEKYCDFVKQYKYPYPLITSDENIDQEYVGSEIRIMTTTHNRSGKLTRLYHICVKILSK